MCDHVQESRLHAAEHRAAENDRRAKSAEDALKQREWAVPSCRSTQSLFQRASNRFRPFDRLDDSKRPILVSQSIQPLPFLRPTRRFCESLGGADSDREIFGKWSTFSQNTCDHCSIRVHGWMCVHATITAHTHVRAYFHVQSTFTTIILIWTKHVSIIFMIM